MTVRMMVGDVIEKLDEIEAGTVQTCVTSPPYFGLRDYGVDGQIGLEPTIEDFLAKMVDVFRGVRRALRDDGTCWINMGDSYAGSRKGSDVTFTESRRRDDAHIPRSDFARRGIKPKDLMMMPARLALALQADGAASTAHMRDIERMIAAIVASYDGRDQWPDRIAAEVERLEREHVDANRGGWYLRQDIIWAKPNPMPESVRDRCTKAHEYIFLLSKSPRYFFDHDALKEPCGTNTHPRLSKSAQAENRKERMPTGWDSGPGSHRSLTGRYPGTGVGFGHGFDAKPKPRVRGPGNVNPPKGQAAYEAGDEHHRTKGGLVVFAEKQRERSARLGREPGWRTLAAAGSGTKNNESFHAAMAVMPERRAMRSVWDIATAPFKEAHFATFPCELARRCIAAGSRHGDLVLDCFGGAGTVSLVAERLLRDSIYIDLNANYASMARRRIENESSLFAKVVMASPEHRVAPL